MKYSLVQMHNYLGNISIEISWADLIWYLEIKQHNKVISKAFEPFHLHSILEYI